MSPDGKFIVHRIGTTTPLDLGVMRLDGEGEPEVLLASEFNEHGGEISPDGQWLAYQSDESGEDRVYVRPFPDVAAGRFPISAGRGTEPVWAPDGSELFYRDGESLMAVPIRTEPSFQAGYPRVLFSDNYSVRLGRMYDVAPDGRGFLMIKPVATDGLAGSQVVLVQNWFEELERLVPTN